MKAANDLPLFAGHANAVPLVRLHGDSATAHAAADRMAGRLSALQRDALAAFSAAGDRGLTGRELEQLPQFAGCAPSTMRKRASELLSIGRLRTVPGPNGKPLSRGGLTVLVIP